MTHQQAISTISDYDTSKLCEMWQNAYNRSEHDDDSYSLLSWIEYILCERNEEQFYNWQLSMDATENLGLLPHKYFLN